MVAAADAPSKREPFGYRSSDRWFGSTECRPCEGLLFRTKDRSTPLKGRWHADFLPLAPSQSLDQALVLSGDPDQRVLFHLLSASCNSLGPGAGEISTHKNHSSIDSASSGHSSTQVPHSTHSSGFISA
jgi:hypothetical protein